MFGRSHHAWLIAAVSVLVSACGGGGGGGSAAPTVPLSITTLELAQSHVLPEAGLSWTLSNASEELHLVGGRSALAVVELAVGNAVNPRLEGRVAGIAVGSVTLNPPSAFPETESGGPAYATGRYSADIPSGWMVPGLELRAIANNYLAGEYHNTNIGADSPMTLRTLPFYLFGADDTDLPFATAADPNVTNSDTVAELGAIWPVANLTVANHPTGHADWPYLVIGPRPSHAAYVITGVDQRNVFNDPQTAVLAVLSVLLKANGEDAGPVQYYAPLVARNTAGAFVETSGGVAAVGGDAAVGDHRYDRTFIHEQGHGFGLPHAGTAFDLGQYPYEWGSLNGSAWGYDSVRREFLAPFVPTSASSYAGCENDIYQTDDAVPVDHPRALDSSNRCVKEDPMEFSTRGISVGDEASSAKFATFSDFNTAVMQRHLEGRTTDVGGVHVYEGGSIVRDASFADGYKRWDGIDKAWVNVAPLTLDDGLNGLEQNLPVQRDVPVAAIVITYSNAGTAGVSQIYPPLLFTGNLIRSIDPTDTAQRASIDPATGVHSAYCENGGCDYTVRVTYVGGTQHHVLIQGGFRPLGDASGVPPASASSANNANSFRTWAVNVPADLPIQSIELLSTPQVWLGYPGTPTVLATR